MQLWLNLSRSGVGFAGGKIKSLDRNLLLSNQLSISFLILSFLLLIFILLLLPANTILMRWLLILQLLLGSTLLLNRFGFHKLTRLLLSTGLPVIVLFSTMHSKLNYPEIIHEGSYYNPRYFLIGVVFIPLMIIDIRERLLLALSLGVNIGILVFFNQIHQLFGAAPQQIGITLDNAGFISVASTFAGLSLVLGMLFLKRDNHKFEEKISHLLQATSAKNLEIESSIRYAKRLQSSILPSSAQLNIFQNDLPLLYLPKDIVSGDFYFLREEDGLKILSVIDCTGHGVPGAFMSIMGYNALKTAVDNAIFSGPAKVMDILQNEIKSQLARNADDYMHDGMDLVFCVIDDRNQTLSYSGANASFFMISDGNVSEYRAERRAIGDDNFYPFTEGSLTYKKGDVLILTSDGYRDQFGGNSDKKMGKARFKEILSKIALTPEYQHAKLLEKEFAEWKADTEQTDDVCVICYTL